jgi:hypothetical protein
MNSLVNCIFKIHVCVWIYQRQWGKRYTTILYMKIKKIMHNFSCKYQKEKYHLE